MIKPIPRVFFAFFTAGLTLGCGSSSSFTADATASGGTTAKAGSSNAGSGNQGLGNAGSGNQGLGNAGSGNAGTAGGVALAGAGAVPPTTNILGKCSTAADCRAVVDTRPVCSCYGPLAASQADQATDPCLVPWSPTTATVPPPGCRDPNGPQCDIACAPGPACVNLGCTGGKCTVTPVADATLCGGGTAGAGGTACNNLQATYTKALAAAQQCDMALNRTTCDGTLPDTCGCKVPYDKLGLNAKAAEDAYTAWSSQCPALPCGRACMTGGIGVCTNTGTTTLGACTFAYPL